MCLGLLAVVKALPGFLSLPQVTPYIPINDTFGASFFAAFLSTLVIEARDKTFVLTALLAATKMRKAVGAGALSTMAFLTVVDCMIGYIFVPLIEEGWVNWAAVVAYLVFSWLFLKDAWYFTDKDVPGSLRAQEGLGPKQPSEPNKDMSAQELALIQHPESLREPLLPANAKHPEPTVTSTPGQPSTPEDDEYNSPKARRDRWLDLYLKAAILMFLGEWSDGTMVSTSELAQKNTFWGVFTGCMLAYCVTTTVAALAGRWLGSKMKYRHMLVLTAFVFLIFAVFTVLY